MTSDLALGLSQFSRNCAKFDFQVHVDILNLSLGKIPLRQLVYRVLDLPPSLRPLVYDFGQLTLDTEKGYIIQMIENYVSM